jgi:hypothetical protein
VSCRIGRHAIDELQRALRSLESSEHGTDERTARLLVQQESR